MTPKERAAMQQALGALVRAEAMYGQPNADIQAALRSVLEQSCPNGCDTSNGLCVDCPDPVSEQSVSQEPVSIDWKPLQDFWRNNSSIDWDELESAVIAAHKEKNK